jgi:hypothetical protein
VVIFNLVTWAERHQQVDTLLEGARKDMPRNVALQQIKVEPQPRGKKTGGVTAGWQWLPGGKRDPEQASIDVFLSYTRNDSRAMPKVLETLR